MTKDYNHKEIEPKWQKFWEENSVYKTEENTAKPKQYILDMFPYPSGAGLHVGHPRGYIGSDVLSRMKRMQGYNVLHPMGFDAFGLPAEQYAIQTGEHPSVITEKAIETYKKQLSLIGLSYDWSREVRTIDPEYYKWTQWIFLKLYDSYFDEEEGKAKPISELITKFEKEDPSWNAKSEKEKQDVLMNHRLAYEGYSEVNWCPELGTVLANDEIVDGPDGKPVSERGGFPVEKKNMRQWFLRITAYADRLLSGLENINWPEHIKEIQKNWIGKSEGAEIEFAFAQTPEHKIKVFTTRPETIFGATFIAVSAGYANQLLENGWNPSDEIKNYISKTLKENENADFKERDKTGIYADFEVINPATGENIPVWITSYVLDGVGTGAIMAVPAHDERDFEFAKKFGLDIKQVVAPIRYDLKNPFVSGWPVIERNMVQAIVRNPKENTYLLLKWKKLPWVTFPGGGLEDGESIQNSALREIQEEAGLTNLKYVATLPVVRSEYSANHKNQNRISYCYACVFETTDETTTEEVEQSELEQHEPIWRSEKDFSDEFVCSEWDVWRKSLLADYDISITEEGSLINSGKWSGLTSEEAKSKITEFVGGKMVTKYKMRDAIFARQRYWGEPIPLIHQTIQPKLEIEFSGEFRYKLIEEGKKEIEIRALDKKERENIGVGDILKFKHIETNESFLVEVEEVIKFKNVDDVYEKGKSMFELIYPNEEIKSVDDLYERFKKVAPDYDKRVDQHGAVGWRVKKVFDFSIIYPISENDLPLKLPNVDSYKPTGNGESPLACVKEWKDAGFETNTMPGWAGSSWYFLRYMDPKNSEAFAGKDAVNYWQDVDVYVGGAEHATGHLLYSRFWHKVLKDLEYVPTEEPFKLLKNQGLILASDGRKMSKRWGNVVNPDEMVDRFGADSFRLYEMFIGPFEQYTSWNTDGLVGTRRFLEKVWRYTKNKMVDRIIEDGGTERLKQYREGIIFSDYNDKKLEIKIHKTIKKITDDIENFRFNTSISSLMIIFNDLLVETLPDDNGISTSNTLGIPYRDLSALIKILAPFAPYMTEELWHELGEKESIHLSEWPKADESKLKDEKVKIAVQVNGKVRDEIEIAPDASEEEANDLALSRPIIQEFVREQKIKKFIYVPGKIVNIVI